jgi:hypothetical protein
MVGVYAMRKLRVHVTMVPELARKLDDYRLCLLERPSRNTIIVAACVEFLKARGRDIQMATTDTSNTTI